MFDNSGSPDYSRFPGADRVQLANPTRFYGPRRIEVGITLNTGAREPDMSGRGIRETDIERRA